MGENQPLRDLMLERGLARRTESGTIVLNLEKNDFTTTAYTAIELVKAEEGLSAAYLLGGMDGIRDYLENLLRS